MSPGSSREILGRVDLGFSSLKKFFPFSTAKEFSDQYKTIRNGLYAKFYIDIGIPRLKNQNSSKILEISSKSNLRARKSVELSV